MYVVPLKVPPIIIGCAVDLGNDDGEAGRRTVGNVVGNDTIDDQTRRIDENKVRHAFYSEQNSVMTTTPADPAPPVACCDDAMNNSAAAAAAVQVGAQRHSPKSHSQKRHWRHRRSKELAPGPELTVSESGLLICSRTPARTYSREISSSRNTARAAGWELCDCAVRATRAALTDAKTANRSISTSPAI